MNKEETSTKEDKSNDTENNQIDKNNIDQPDKENAEEAKELSLDEKIKELEEKIVKKKMKPLNTVVFLLQKRH